jgi:hypothetical protein
VVDDFTVVSYDQDGAGNVFVGDGLLDDCVDGAEADR